MQDNALSHTSTYSKKYSQVTFMTFTLATSSVVLIATWFIMLSKTTEGSLVLVRLNRWRWKKFLSELNLTGLLILPRQSANQLTRFDLCEQLDSVQFSLNVNSWVFLTRSLVWVWAISRDCLDYLMNTLHSSWHRQQFRFTKFCAIGTGRQEGVRKCCDLFFSSPPPC